MTSCSSDFNTMPKLTYHRKTSDASKYSCFFNDPSSTNTASNEDLERLASARIFTTVNLNNESISNNRKPQETSRTRKILDFFCPCCGGTCKKEISEEAEVDAEFALVRKDLNPGGQEGDKSSSRCSTLRLGEKTLNTAKFVSDVLNCRDVFLHKLEHDGTLGRKNKNLPHIMVNYVSEGGSIGSACFLYSFIFRSAGFA